MDFNFTLLLPADRGALASESSGFRQSPPLRRKRLLMALNEVHLAKRRLTIGVRFGMLLANHLQTLRSKNAKVAAVCLAGVIVRGTMSGGEIIQAPVKERRVAELPKGPAIDGSLPRPVLMIKLHERGEFPGSRTVSSYWTFDPGEPGKGLHKIFSGPGDDQYLRFMTPLFGGYGLASGQLDPKTEPEGDGSWFWFNPITGKTGPTVEADLSTQWMDEGWWICEQWADRDDGKSVTWIVRYHPLHAIVRTTELDFSCLDWVGRSEVLGVARLEQGERVVQMDVKTSKYEVIGEPPPGYHPGGNGQHGFDFSPAGKNCRDGVYAINGFSLWFRPRNGAWHSVIRDVHIMKTFGGAGPQLFARYVGDGRFAVPKTVKDSVEVPESTPPDEALFPAAEAVTMLIDSVTGKVLKESRPFIYNHSPLPEFPEDWWAAGLKPKPAEPEVAPKSLFQWDEKNREVRFAGDKVVKLGEDDEHEVSGDGCYMVIYQQCPRGGGKAKTKVPIRILDGRTGQVHSAEVTSDFYEVWVEPFWEVLCSASPDPKILKDYQDAGPGP